MRLSSMGLRGKSRSNLPGYGSTRICRAFTLLEIVIAIALIGMVASAISFQVAKMVRSNRFLHSLELVRAEFEKAQLLSMLYGSEMEVKLVKEGEEWKLNLSTDEVRLKALNKRSFTLKAIESITAAANHSGKRRDIESVWKFKVLPSGEISPRGTFELQGAEGSRWLNLEEPLVVKLESKYLPYKGRSLPPKPIL